MSKPIVLTGLRANSDFHIGNYLGAILPVVELQKKHAGEYQVNMFVPDLHSFTTPIDHSKLYRQIIDNLRVFVAAGLNISDSDTYIYRQSYIPAHSELTWVLDCFTGFGELSRMTQFKDKSQQLSDSDESVSVGLFNYPALMAADILLYGAKYVPVGDDQKQHLELTRDLAIRLNNKFEQDLFVVPEAWGKQLEFASRDAGVRIRSLRNPEKKMSKSVSDPSGTIMITDNPQEAAKKIMRAETDSYGEIKYDFHERPGISNLLQMLALLTERPQAEVNAEWEGQTRYGDLKKAVADTTESFLTDLQTRLNSIDEDALLAKLAADERAMNQVANETLLRVQKAVGLRP
jgi:tryptophanyl-tRNA synthetase